jgi:hypothetical protein
MHVGDSENFYILKKNFSALEKKALQKNSYSEFFCEEKNLFMI